MLITDLNYVMSTIFGLLIIYLPALFTLISVIRTPQEKFDEINNSKRGWLIATIALGVIGLGFVIGSFYFFGPYRKLRKFDFRWLSRYPYWD